MSSTAPESQDPTKGGLGAKGMRVQGFKGFKLKVNSQILFKTSGLKPNPIKTPEKLPQPHITSPRQNPLKSPTLKSPPHKSPLKNRKNENQHTPNKSNIFEIMAGKADIGPPIPQQPHAPKLTSPVKKSDLTLDKSRSIIPTNVKSDDKKSRSSDVSSKEIQSNVRTSRARSRSTSRDRSRQRWSHDEERTNLSRTPKRSRRSRSRDRSYRRREPRRSREFVRSSFDSRKSSNTNSNERSHTNRKRHVTSSDSSDDDITMRRMRERRSGKSPLKYSSKKKVKHESHEDKKTDKTRKKSPVKVDTNVQKKDRIVELGVRKSSSEKPNKNEVKTTKPQLKSVVPLASIGCWLEDEDDEEEQPSDEKNERNVFDSLLVVTSQSKQTNHDNEILLHHNEDQSHHNQDNNEHLPTDNETENIPSFSSTLNNPTVKGNPPVSPTHLTPQDDPPVERNLETLKTPKNKNLETEPPSPQPNLHDQVHIDDETIEGMTSQANDNDDSTSQTLYINNNSLINGDIGNYTSDEDSDDKNTVVGHQDTRVNMKDPSNEDTLCKAGMMDNEGPHSPDVNYQEESCLHGGANVDGDVIREIPPPPSDVIREIPPPPSDVIGEIPPSPNSITEDTPKALSTAKENQDQTSYKEPPISPSNPINDVPPSPTLQSQDNTVTPTPPITNPTPPTIETSDTPDETSEHRRSFSCSLLPAKKRWFKALAEQEAKLEAASIEQDTNQDKPTKLPSPPNTQEPNEDFPRLKSPDFSTRDIMTANVKQSHPTSLPNHEFIPKPPDFPPNPHEPPKYAISSPESPLFSPGSESPCIAPQMTAFDDASSGTDEMCDPISIRIPVDDHGRVNDTNQNTELEVTGSKMELDVTLTQDNQDAVNDKQANNTEPTIDSVSDASNSAVDETAEGRRRSARIMTKMQKRKSRWSSRPQGVDSPTPEVQNKTENMDLLFDKQQQQQQQQQEEEEDKVKTVGENALSNTASPSFEAISDNIYLCEKKKSRVRKEIRRMVCECDNNEDGTPCGSDCLNRLLMIECSARCPLGEQCQNKRFQRKQYVPTEVFQTKWKGWGIRATENLSPGMLVMEYCGEVLDLQEFGRRSLLYSRGNQQHFYFMALSQDEIIDATTKGNTSRFINHSCDPNCETQKWTVNGRLRVGFFTMRDINKGEEITFDYQFQRYGKEAQACYCGSSNCRGYLGKAPDEDDDVIADDVIANDVTCVDDVSKFEDNSAVITSVATETGRKKKRKRTFKDDPLESEISGLKSGLQSNKEVLVLSRSMVKCETTAHRLLCLNVLRKTDNQGCLRSFLQFHGLPLLWSWMVDLTSSSSDVNSSYFKLKMEILNVLSMLPISNLNMLQDSKVISMVRRWAEEELPTVVPTESESERETSKPDVLTSGESPTQTSDKLDVNNCENKDELEVAGEQQTSNIETTNTNVENPPESLTDLNSQIVSSAENLLYSWKDLKEIYRIPKRQQSVDAPQGGESERSVEERSSSQASSPSVVNHDGNTGHHYDEYYDRDRDRRSREPDRDRSRRSPLRGRRDNESRPNRQSSNENGGKYAWLNASSEKSSKLSREEHRRQFERDVRHREDRSSRKRWDVKSTTASQGIWPLPAPTVTTLGMSKVPLPPPQVLHQTPILSTPPITTPTPQTSSTFTPSGYSGNLIQINPQPPPVNQTNPIYTGFPQATPTAGKGLLPTPLMLPTNSVNQGPSVGVLASQPQQQAQAQGNFSQQTITQQIIQPQQTMTQQIVQQPQTAPNPGVTILGSQGGQAIVLLTAEQLQQLTGQNTSSQPSTQPQATQPQQIQNQMQQLQLQQQILQEQNLIQQQMLQNQLQPLTLQTQLAQQNLQIRLQQLQLQQQALQQQSTQPQALQQVIQPSQPIIDAPTPAAQSAFNPPTASPPYEVQPPAKPASPPRDPRPPRLPRNWKSATDAEGSVYYYHVITRKTQWEAPSWDAVDDEETLVKKPSEATNSVNDGKQKPSENAAGSITEEAKKAREAFRSKMSQHIVYCLNSYRKPECKIGRITSTEDFKRLARKLTHNVLMKEIKQVIVWEDLEYNANVKHKAKEYVKKYMAKMGPIYKARDDDEKTER